MALSRDPSCNISLLPSRLYRLRLTSDLQPTLSLIHLSLSPLIVSLIAKTDRRPWGRNFRFLGKFEDERLLNGNAWSLMRVANWSARLEKLAGLHSLGSREKLRVKETFWLFVLSLDRVMMKFSSLATVTLALSMREMSTRLHRVAYILVQNWLLTGKLCGSRL